MEIGLNKAQITGNSIQTIETKDGPKPAVVLNVEVDSGSGPEAGKVTIWLTDKALGIAYKHLKTCGFDPQTEDFGILIEKPDRLAGKVVDVIIEKRGNYFNISLPLGSAPPSKAEIQKIGKALREVKKKDSMEHDDEGEGPPPEPAKAGKAPEPDPLNLDDIPFAILAAVGLLGAMLA